MRLVEYDQAFMFAYSQRERSHAHRNYEDDVPHEVKLRRLQEVIETFHSTLKTKTQQYVGSIQCVLVTGKSHRSSERLTGRCDDFRKVNFDLIELPTYHPDQPLHDGMSNDNVNDSIRISSASHVSSSSQARRHPRIGDYVAVKVTSSTSLSLQGIPHGITTLKDFYRFHPFNKLQLRN